uniref:uncharacterized protein LOC120337322 n=1 Tax=Styela clava TaxID=7725 RepID=UPI00193A2B8A|nr:uncharacterized protein LOC120337322 [Styela clava]
MKLITRNVSIPNKNDTVQNIHNGKLYDGNIMWYCCQVVLCIMTAMLIYISICLSWLLWSSCKNRFGNTKDQQSIPRGRRASVSSKRRHFRMFMRIFCLFAAVATLIKCLADQLKFFYAWNANSDDICELVYDITDVTIYAFAYFGVYGFLWIKQWLFYCDPITVKFLYSRRLVIFNKLFVVAMLILGVLCAAANWIPHRYGINKSTLAHGINTVSNNANYVGCVALYDMSDEEQRWPLICYAALNAFFQVVLMTLFIYPVAWDKLQKWKCKRGYASGKQTEISITCNVPNTVAKPPSFPEDTNSVKPQSEGSKIAIGRRHEATTSERSLSEKALKSIRRTILLTAICIITDMTLVAVYGVVSKGVPVILVAVSTDFNLLINVICIIGTYQTWTQIMFPFCVTADDIPQAQNSTVRLSTQDK